MTTTTTTSAAPEAAAPDASKVNALIGAIGSLEESYVTITTDAFRNLCSAMGVHVTTLNDYYNQVNTAVNKGKRGATDISFERFYGAVAAACATLNRTTPERRATRIMFTFARKGSTDKMQRKFLNVAGLTGDFGVSIEEYVRFLGVESDYTATGSLTDAATARRATEEAERQAREAIRKASLKARPIGFDFSGMIPADLRDEKHAVDRASWLLQLQQDLAVFVASELKSLPSDAKRTAARNKANSEIKRAAKRV
jgi:hypothetical protein